MWQIPLQSQVTNLNLHTLLLNGPTVQESINSMYSIPSSAAVLEYIELFNNDPARPLAAKVIHDVYELPSIKRTIRCLHVASGLPTKSKWIKSIRNWNYLTWPLITVKISKKHFP